MTTAIETATKNMKLSEVTDKPRIGEILVRTGKITEEQLNACLAEQQVLKGRGEHKYFGKIVVDHGFASEADIQVAVALRQKTGPVSPADRRKSENIYYRIFIDKVIAEIGEEKYNEAVLKRDKSRDVHIIYTLNSMRFLSYDRCAEILRTIVEENGCKNIYCGHSEKDIEVNDGQVYVKRANGEVEQVFPVYFPQDSSAVQVLLGYKHWNDVMLETSIQQQDEKDLEDFEDMVKIAIDREASDIHIIPNGPHYRVFFRIDGRLVEDTHLIMNLEQGQHLTKMIKIKASDYINLKIEETRLSHSGRIEFDNLKAAVRLEFLPDGVSQVHLETIARIISKRTNKITACVKTNLKQLGYLDADIPHFSSVSRRPGGLIVMSGVSGSGKTTFVLNILPGIDKSRLVGTIEDPIELLLDQTNVKQHQLYILPEGQGMGFQQYVTSIKRADYNVVFIGEWRKSDGLTESIIEQSHAGHLLFTTLHIKSSFNVYSAIKDMFGVSKSTSASLILMSINQTLVPKLCPKCKKPGPISFSVDDTQDLTMLSKKEKEALVKFSVPGGCQANKDEDGKVIGCEHCYGTGYRGRIPIYDYFTPTHEFIGKLLKEDMEPTAIKDMVVDDGIGRTKLSVLKEHMMAGTVDKESIQSI